MMKRTKKIVPFLCLVLLGLNCGFQKEYQVEFLNLKESQLVQADSVNLSFSVFPEDWIDKGYSVHVLLDRYHFKILSEELTVTFPGLSAGSHAIFVFVCDQNGVCLKTDGSLAIRNFYSQKRTQPFIKLDKPLLVLHQPQKRKYIGDEGLRILLDFRVLNAELGKQYQVHYYLDGLDLYLNSEKHVWIEEARRIGDHKLIVSLETLDGNIDSSNPINSITKKFLVVEK